MLNSDMQPKEQKDKNDTGESWEPQVFRVIRGDRGRLAQIHPDDKEAYEKAGERTKLNQKALDEDDLVEGYDGEEVNGKKIEDDANPITHIPANRDLIYDLGPKNEYDVTAGEAYKIGRELKDFRLVDMGTELGELIRSTPYDHDRFYRVIAKSGDIKRRISELREMQKYENDRFEVRFDDFASPMIFETGAKYPSTNADHVDYNKVLTPYVSFGTYQIVDDNAKAGELQEEVEQLICNLLSIELDKLYSNIEQIGQTRYIYYYRDDCMVAAFMMHNHEIGYGVDTEFFEKDLDQAKTIWEELKKRYSGIDYRKRDSES